MSALVCKDANLRPGSLLSGLSRGFEKTQSLPANLDQDSDELPLSEWPLSQEPTSKVATNKMPIGHPRSSNSIQASSAHWRTKSAASFMNIDTKIQDALSHKRTLSSMPSSSALPPMTKSQDLSKKRRDFPWDMLEGPSKKAKVGISNVGSSAFRTIGAEPGPSLPFVGPKTFEKDANLASKSLNIKQKVILSPEQQRVLQLVVEQGKSVFFTGSAGTGKSVLLREIIASLRKKYRTRADGVCVTASTGMAACNIGGTTIHSFAGIGLGVESVDQLVLKVKKQKKANSRWLRALVLVIDEVSMVDGDLFDKLANLAQQVRKKTNLPFGGIQLIVTGDFFQLPPVTKGSGPTKFCFDSASWKECIQYTVNLSQVFRQKDTEFIDMLNELRFGTLSTKSTARFMQLSRRPTYPADGIEPTELFPKRDDVERSNKSRLANLPGAARIFVGEDSGEVTGDERKRLLENFMAPGVLELKEGCQVMLIKNKDENLVNGSIGIVSHFAPPGGTAEDADEDMDFNGGGHEFDFREDNGEASKKKKGRTEEEVPWITWSLSDGRKSPAEPVAREEFKVEQGNVVKIKRKQFPIMLAWAVSIHKSQGQTLARVKVDLSKVFEAGQTYVALSRATSIDALQVIGFNSTKVRCHPRVRDWAKTLMSVSSLDD